MKYLLTLLGICSIGIATAQTINWASVEENQKHILTLNLGYDYGLTTQIGYGYQLNLFKPLILSTDFSIPMGNDIMDDFKLRIGGQMPVFGFKNYQLTVKINTVYRKHQTELVTMSSFGSETAILFGIYKSKWHLAAEIGYDNAGTTFLKHSQKMKEIFPSIKDGWFASTGGNFFYGIQGTKTIGKKIDIALRLGATNARLNDESSIIPLYFQLGVNYRM